MTLEEAIVYVETVVKANESLVSNYESDRIRAEIHRQLAEWLRELQERRKELEIVRCGECKHKRDHHYEDPGEEPYIKSTCENKYGLVKGYQVDDWDFCSRAERRTDD